MKALEPIMESLSSEATYRKFQESWRRAVRRHPDLTAGQKVVLLALQEYQNHETRTAWPKVETLMADCNLGERAVRSATSKALKVGLLVKVASGQNVRESGNTANVWAFTVPETVTNDEEGCTSVQGGVHERAGQGCTSVPPNPVLNPGMNPGTISSNPSGSKCVSEKENDQVNINDNGDEPVLLPEDWNYNDTHMTLMDEKLPGHHHDLVAAVFASEFDGHHSSDWDKKFSWWINHVVADEHAMSRFEATMDTFADIDPPAPSEAA